MNGAGKTGQLHAINKTRPLSYKTNKINSQWIKDLNVTIKTIKLLKENMGGKQLHIFFSNVFLDPTPKARGTKEKLNKWDYFKLKASALQRKPSTKQKGNLLNERRFL